MKKNKKTKQQKASSLKRGTKRGERLKKTKGLKWETKLKKLAEIKRVEKKQGEELLKIFKYLIKINNNEHKQKF